MSGNGGGTIQLQGGNIRFTEGSQAFTITNGGVPGGGVGVDAHESLALIGTNSPTGGFPSGLGSVVGLGATGAGGNVTIETPILQVLDGGQVFLEGYGEGKIGNLTVQAKQVKIFGTAPLNRYPSVLYSIVRPNSQGSGGDITFNTEELLLSRGGQILATTLGVGNASNITIRATTLQEIAQATDPIPSQIATTVLQGGTGKGGTLTIDMQQLTLQGGAQAVAVTDGAGESGKIVVRATDILLDSLGIADITRITSGLLTAAYERSTGNAGDITVDTQSLVLRNGAQLFSGTRSRGNGGNIAVKAATIEVDGTDGQQLGSSAQQLGSSAITSSVAVTGQGNAGMIAIDTGSLRLTNGGQVLTATQGKGKGGNIRIQARDIVASGTFPNELSQSGILTGVLGPRAQGNGGMLEIVADRLQIHQGAVISSR